MISFFVLAAAVVVLSALCSMAEAAYLSLPLVRARALAKLGGRTAQAVLRIRERVQNAISALTIMSTVFSLVGMALVVVRAQDIGSSAAGEGDFASFVAAWITPVLTVTVVLFGEIVPKAIGERFHVGIAMAAAYPVLALIGLFRPFVWGTEKLVDGLFPRRRRSVTSEEEIAAMAEEARREGTIRISEAEVIQRVFRLNDITAEDVMTPRIRSKMLPADRTLEEARAELFAIPWSRIPVYAGTRDNVSGILRRADALRALAEGKSSARLSDLAGPAKFVPAATIVDRLLREFQRERLQFAVVVGEYGETVGVVTLDDILAELVGEMLDEKDVDEHSIKRISRDEILVHGQTGVDRVNHFFNTELPEDRPTIAGFLLDRLGRLPKAGEHVVAEGIDLVVDEVNDRAIVRVRVLKPAPDRAASAPEEKGAAAP